MSSSFDEAGFLQLYAEYCGKTEVPQTFSQWAGIGLLAAAAQDRVFIEKHAGSRLVPNLYILLLGPSGLGKGQAIGHAVRLAEPLEAKLNVFWGRLSGPALADHIGNQTAAGDLSGKKAVKLKPLAQPETINIGRVWLVAEELALSIGSGPRAHDFVTFMTGLYSGSPVPFQDRTRSHGLIKIQSPAINWLAGSTRDWLLRSVSRDAVEGGFFARVLVVEAEYDFNYRIAEPMYPTYMDELVDELRERLSLIMRIKAANMVLTREARDIANHWYDERPAPEDMALAPSWRRQQDMMYKLAMVLALSDWTRHHRDEELPVPTVEGHHIVDAQRLVREAQRALPDLVRVAATTKETMPIEAFRDIIKRGKSMQHAVVVRKMGGRGFNAQQTMAAAHELDVQGLVVIKRANGNGHKAATYYEWKQREPVAVGDDDADDYGPGGEP